jgi:CRP-like cAMP-binding protein
VETGAASLIYIVSMPLLRKPADAPIRDEGGERIASSRSGLPAALAALGRRREVSAGTVLFREGDRAESCFLLERGEVALRRVSRRGEEVEIARIAGGEWFGEVVLFSARDYPARAVAVKDGAVVEFSRSAVLSSPDREVAAFFLDLLARKCLALNRRIDQLTVMDARERLASYILGRCPGARSGCAGNGTACVFALPAKKREIALELGMVPETLSRTFRQMEAEGLFKVRGPTIEIPSCARLRGILED